MDRIFDTVWLYINWQPMEMIMKRLLILCMALFLLSACSLANNTQDTTASLSLKNSEMIEVTVDQVWTDMRPFADSNLANVNFRLEIGRDAIKLGSDNPIVLYGGGTIEVENKDFAFSNERQFIGEGQGKMMICANGDNWENQLFYPCGLPVTSLTAQIGGFASGVESVKLWGLVASANAKEDLLDFPGLSVANISDIGQVQCNGRLLPDSNMAQIIMIGEYESGEPFRGGGLISLGEAFDGSGIAGINFQCELDGKASVGEVTSALSEGMTMWQLSLNDLKLTFENGQSIRVNTANGFLMC